MKILGYSGLNHDSSVALLVDGNLLFASESEKIRRVKHEICPFPEQAVRSLLAATGLEMGDIDAFAVNYAAGFLENWAYIPHLWSCLKQGNADLGVIVNVLTISASHSRAFIRYSLNGQIPPIFRVKHHLAHLSSTFLFSPYEEAAVAVVDGSGEIDCTSTYYCAGRSIRRFETMTLPTNSLGLVYMRACRHLGYRLLGDEYKVMGLAAFGSPDPNFRKFFEELIVLEKGGRYKVNPRLAGRMSNSGCQFPEKVSRRLGGRHKSGPEAFTEIHMNFAWELQRRFFTSYVI